MRKVLFYALLFSFAIQAQAQRAKRLSEAKATKQELVLYIGLQSTLDLGFDPCAIGGSYEECIRIAHKTLVTVQYSKDKRQMIFTPLKKGETTVTVRDEKGDIRLILKTVVNESNLARRLLELKELLRDIEGVELKIMADKIIVDGEVVVVGDLNRLYAVLSDTSYKDSVLNLVTVSPVGLQILAERIQAEINNPNVKVRVLNGLFLLEGQVESAGQAESAVNIARSMVQGFALPTYNLQGPNTPIDVKRATVKDPIIVRLTIAPSKPKPLDKMLRVTVDFVELSKDYLRNFGFSWIPSLDSGGSISFGQSTTGGVTTQGNGSLAGTIGNLFPKLNTAQNAGYARVLEESVMIVKDGKVARLEKVLQVPVQTINEKGQPTFQVVDIGPKIQITPRLIQGQGENIDMNIDFFFAGLAGKQGSAPTRLNHVYKSDVIIKSGESAAIVNALSNAISTAFNKDPPGGSVPGNPLFTLLRSKAFQKNKSQFVVFITPQIIESASQGTEDIKNKYGLKRKL